MSDTGEQPVQTSDSESLARRAAAYPSSLATHQRKQQGAWFTPLALALPTVERTLQPLLANGDPARLRIVDPAVGGGTFLVAALQVLVRAGLRPSVAARCLHGLDSDASAATLAAAVVREACGDDAPDPDELAANIRAGDGLLDLPAASFDAVLTNPPWETLQSGDGAPLRVARLRPHFHHQGRGKLYTYRLFVERTHQLLRDGGRFGLVVPASLWFDRDAEPLRRLLLDTCTWEWLFGFENRKKVFAIDGRYRFAVITGQKGGTTTAVRTAFGRIDVDDWAMPAPPHTLYGREELRALSPGSGAFVEACDRRDLDILQRMAGHGQALLGRGGAFAWRQGDFNMTSDRDQFVLRAAAETRGYAHRGDGVWRCPGEPDLLPLVQGAMVYDLHPNAAVHEGGTGHTTAWGTPSALDDYRPAYLVQAAPWRAKASSRDPARIVLRALSNATNERTAVPCLLPDVPCGNSLGVLTPRGFGRTPLRAMAASTAVLGSLPFDYALRLRLGGTNLNAFVLADCLLPRLEAATETELAQLALRLCAVLAWQGELWQLAAAEGWRPAEAPAISRAERRDLAVRIDVLVGAAFGLSHDDIAWIVRGCDAPAAGLRRGRNDAGHSKGFWRVDRDLPPMQRRPVCWLGASTAGAGQRGQK